MSKVGRPARTIEWIPVRYKDSDYIVGKIQFNDSYIYCVNDASQLDKLKEQNWHVVTGAYIGCYKMHDGKRKTLYLHNHIMDRDGFQGKGQDTTIDHINGMGFDNRSVNLREVSQSFQNFNTKQRTRTAKLPEGLSISELPRNIWYIPASGGHGERFAVEFKGIPSVGEICRKTTSSKHVSLQDKLNEAIEIKKEILETHPILKQYLRDSENAIILKQEYDEIVSLASN